MTTTDSATATTAFTLTADHGFGPVLLGVFTDVDEARLALRARARQRDPRHFGPLHWSADRMMASYTNRRGNEGCVFRVERHELKAQG